MKLNKEQEQAAEAMTKFLMDPSYEKPYFVLTGAAGTGKTTMLKEVLRALPYPNTLFARTAAAVAHAAKNVLIQSLDGSLDFFTVAQWLGLNMNYTEDGEIIFTPSKRSNVRLKHYDLAILDEASQINDELYHQIVNVVQQRKIKLIVLGDIYQLPPVEQEHDSLFFENIDGEHRFTHKVNNVGFKEEFKYLTFTEQELKRLYGMNFRKINNHYINLDKVVVIEISDEDQTKVKINFLFNSGAFATVLNKTTWDSWRLSYL